MIIKHSMGGSITQIEDNNEIENKEITAEKHNNISNYLVICDGCNIQHVIVKGEKRVCDCGHEVKYINN